MLLHADFGVEIAGTMWIVLSVFSKIRITMAFAQLTHSHSLITCPLCLCPSDHITADTIYSEGIMYLIDLSSTFSPELREYIRESFVTDESLDEAVLPGPLPGGEALVWG